VSRDNSNLALVTYSMTSFVAQYRKCPARLITDRKLLRIT